MKDTFDGNAERKAWMGILAKATEGRVAALLEAAQARPEFTWLRAPEIGSTMVRGRAGGTGAPFNIGEVTVTRCALTLATGEVGHADIQGRRKSDAEAAALVDALMQGASASAVRKAVLVPLEAEQSAAKTARAEKAAATKVEFFTMARGKTNAGNRAGRWVRQSRHWVRPRVPECHGSYGAPWHGSGH